MSQDLISQFIDAMRSAGIGPGNAAGIIADNKRRDYHIDGDPTNRKKGFYKIKIDGSFGFGFFGDYRQGDFHSWSSATPSDYTDEERAAWRERMAQERAQEAADLAKQHAHAAIEAQGDILFLDPASDDHPYLVAKGVKSYGLLASGHDLIVPMMLNDEICNYQTIKPDGFKLYKEGARKQGTWYAISGVSCSSSIICICEGYATGASITAATGYSVIVTFDAGNMVSTAAAIRAKYPQAILIYCADNDRFTKRPDGTPYNPGIVAATKAASIANGLLCYPVFEADDPEKATDFNDLHALRGYDAVAKPIREAVSVSPPEQAPADNVPVESVSAPHGDSQTVGGGDSVKTAGEIIIVYNGNRPDPRSMHNAIIALENQEDLVGLFRYNEFKSDIFLCRCPPWDNPATFRVRRIENVDITRLEAWLEIRAELKPGPSRLMSAIESVADNNRFHPVREYFDGLVWDGIERLPTWLIKYTGALFQPPEYLKEVGMTWMVAAAARIYEPGKKFDHMLILEGPQNSGKSLLLRILGTFGRDIEETYYTDAINFNSIEERGSILKLQGNLIIEFPELAGLGKKDQDELKRWITLQVDEVEVKYKQMTHILPRQFVLAGTYNPIAGVEWLSDPTGGRRFWPVTVGDKIDIDGVRAVREQLWAEAVARYKAGHKLWHTREDSLFDLLGEEQIQRADIDLWQDRVEAFLTGLEYTSTAEVLTGIGVETKHQNNRTDKVRIAKIMRNLGWQYKDKMINRQRRKAWTPPEKEQAELPIYKPQPAAPVHEEEIEW